MGPIENKLNFSSVWDVCTFAAGPANLDQTRLELSLKIGNSDSQKSRQMVQRSRQMVQRIVLESDHASNNAMVTDTAGFIEEME